MPNRVLFYIGIIIFSLEVLVWGPAVTVGFALPEADQVVSGSAELTYPDASTLRIDASDKAIINYKSFNIAETESVIINLPNQDNAILNRVIGTSASSILGRLTTNGIFMLVNPNGINIGKSANIDAAGFLASTRDISNANFLEAKYLFNKLSQEQKDALLLNQGLINVRKGGFGVMIAGGIENQGTIIAPLGRVAMAAGDMVTLDISGNNLISVAIDQATASTIYDQNGKPISQQIKNTGRLEADGGVVMLKAENVNEVFNKAINLSGYVQAVKLENKNGLIKIVAQRDVAMEATLLASKIEVGIPEEAVPENVEVKGGTLTAEEGGVTLLAKNNLTTNANITSSGDIRIMADYDHDKQGEFTQAGGTIYAKEEADIYLDGSGTMTLGTVKTEEGSIKIGTQRVPDSIIGNPSFVHTQGDIEITKIEQAEKVATLETERGDILRYNPQGNLALEAASGKIELDLGSAIPAATLFLAAQGIEVNSQAKTTEIYKHTGDINLTSTQLNDNLVTLTGEALKVTYIKANNLTLRTDNAVNVTPGLIITANQVKVIARQFGTNEVPLNIAANLTYLRRTQGDIEIMQSLGLGSSIFIRGPPQGGFGAISYEKTTLLTLEAANVVLKNNFSFYNDTVIQGNLRVEAGEIRGEKSSGLASVTIQGDLRIQGEGYTYFGWQDAAQGKDYRFNTNLKGGFYLDNPNAWVYSNINFTGNTDQVFDDGQGTLYANINVQKETGRLISASGYNLTGVPLYFVPNLGQIRNPEVKFYLYSGKGLIYFTPASVWHMVDGYSLRLNFLQANPHPEIRPELPTGTIYNYFLGNDPSLWKSNIPSYYKIVYEELLPGIDLVYSSKEGKLESEFMVEPLADYTAIKLSYAGINGLTLDAQGNLLINSAVGQLKEAYPYVYQDISGMRKELAAEYVLLSQSSYGFKIQDYAPGYPLVIDPTLAYSTFIGGSGSDQALAIAVDSSGNAYITGSTMDAVTDFPTTVGAYNTTHNGNSSDVFVAKFNSTGSSLTYSTFVGGSNGTATERAYAIAIDSSGNAYVTGTTGATNFPTTVGAYDTSHNGAEDVFVFKLNSTGTSLTYSTFLGGVGSDDGRGIAVDTSGNAYVTGNTAIASSDFPTTVGAYDTSHSTQADAFVTKLNSAGTGLSYSTFLGTDGGDTNAYAIVVDSSGNAYVTGKTLTIDNSYFTTAGAYDTTFNGGTDVFVLKFNSTATSVTYGTFLGGAGVDIGYAIAVDSSGNAYVTGNTGTTGDFPTTVGAYDTTSNGERDVFVAKLNSTGASLTYSTYLGGGDLDIGYGIAVDSSGNAYVTGIATNHASAFPTTVGAYDTSNNGAGDAFYSKLNSTGTSLLYSTFIGSTTEDDGFGIGLDSSNNVYIAGQASDSTFPTTAGAYDTSWNGGGDAVLFKFASAFTWDGSSSTNWGTAANWDLEAVPDSTSDSVVIADVANDPILDTARTVNTLTINASGILDLNGQNLTFNSTFTNNGSLRLVGTETLTGFVNDTDTGTIDYKGTGAYSGLNGGSSYYNLTFSGSGTWTLGANLDVNGTLTITSAFLDVSNNNYAINVAGNWTNNSNFTSRSGRVTFDGTAAQTISMGGQDFYNLTIANTAAAVSLGGGNGTDINGTLTINSDAIFDIEGQYVTVNTLTNNGTFRLQGAENPVTITTMDTDSGTVTYDGTGNYTGFKAGYSYYNLTFNGTGTWTMNAGLDVNNNLTITAGTLNTSAFNYAFTVGGNWSNSGSFVVPNTVTTVNFDGSSAQTIVSGGTGDSQDFYNLRISNTSAAVSLNTNAIDIDGTLTIDANAIFDIEGQNLTAATLSNDGTLRLQGGETVTITTMDTNSGTVTYDGAAAYASLAAGSSYYNLAFSGSGSWALGANLTVNNILTIGNSATFDLESRNLTATTLSNSGTLRLQGGETVTITNGMDTDSGTVTYDGGGGYGNLAAGNNYYNLTLNGAGAWILIANIDVNGNLTITAGTLANSQNINVAGNWSNAGTFTSNAATVIFDGTAAQTIVTGGTGAGQDFDNLRISNTSAAVSLSTNAIDIDGTLTIDANAIFDIESQNLTAATLSNNGTLRLQGGETVTITNGMDNDSGTVTYDGTASYASGLVAGNSYYSLTFNGAGGSWTLGAALDVNNNLTIINGTLDVSGVGNYAITIAGNFSNAGTFTARSGTVTLDGTASGRTITSSGTSFYNLMVNGVGGAWTLQDALDVNNNLTLTQGTLDVSTSNYAITLGGNFTRTLGTFTARSGTVTFDTVATTSTISGATTFYNFTSTTANKAITFTAGATQTITGTLTLTGSVGNLIVLRSSAGGVQWSIDPQGTRSVSYVDVRDSNNTNASSLSATASTNSGNNTNWSFGAIITWNGSSSTAWGTASNWGSNTVPTSDDAVIIADVANDPVLGANVSIVSLTINTSAILDLAGYNLTLTSTFTNNGTLQLRGSETLTGVTNDTDSGTVLYNGTGAYNSLAAGNSYYNLTFNGSGLWSLNAALAVNNSLAVANGTFDANARTNTVTGLVTVSGGTYLATTATQTLNGGLTISGGTFTGSTGTVDVNGNLTLSLGTLNAPTGTFTVSGNWSQTGGNFPTTADTTVTFDAAAGTQTLNSGGAIFYNLTHSGAGTLQLTTNALVAFGAFSNSAGTYDANALATTVTGLATVSGGTYSASTATQTFNGGLTISGGTFTGSSGSVDVNGPLTLSSGTLTAPSGTFMVSGNWARTGGTFTPGANTVTFDAAAGTQTLNSGGSSFYNLTHSGAGTLQLSTNALAVTGAFSNSAGTFDANGLATTVTGLTTVSGGTYSASTATQTFNGGLTISGGTFTGSSGTVDVNGALNFSSGLLTAPSGTFSVSGNWANTGGLFTPGTNTVTFDAAAGTQTLNSGGASFYNLTHSGAGTLQLTTNALVVSGAFSNSAGTFDANGLATTVTGLATVSGGTYSASTATQTFNGGLTISGGTFTGSSGTVDVNGALSLSSGTLTAPSGTFTVSGNWARTGGTFTPGTNTVTFDAAAGTQTLNSGGSSFYNLTHSGAGTLQLSTNALAVTGAFTNSAGTFDANALATTVTGLATLSDSIYSASTATQTFNGGLTISSSGNFTGSSGTVDVNGALNFSSGLLTAPSGTFSVSGNWANTGGLFTPGTNTVTFDAAAGTQTLNSGGASFYNLTHSGAGTLQLTTNALVVSGAFSNSAGTFDANGLATTVTGLATVSGGTYSASTATQTFNGGLTISGGTFTGSSGTVDVNGALSLSSGTLTAPSGTFTVSGNWANTGGTFTPGTNTVTFDGASASIVSGSTTFYNFTSTTAGKALTFTAGTTQTITGTLTLTGASGSLIVLRSTSSGTQWSINPQGTRSVSYVDVMDSNNTNSTVIDPTNSTNSGNNTNWFPTSSTVTNAQVENSTKSTDTTVTLIVILLVELKDEGNGGGGVEISTGGGGGGLVVTKETKEEKVEVKKEEVKVEVKKEETKKEETKKEETKKEEVKKEAKKEEAKKEEEAKKKEGGAEGEGVGEEAAKEGRYEGGEEPRYAKLYLPGKYRTVVIVFEGRVMVAPYDEQGIIEVDKIILSSGEKIAREGEIK